MKRVLSIIFGLVLVGCLTGCQSTKVETPVVEAPVEERIHPATQRLELKGLSKTGIVEIGLNEKWELDVVDDWIVTILMDGCKTSYGGKGLEYKKVDIEYFGWETDEIVIVTAYLNNPFNKEIADYWKKNYWGMGWFYEDSKIYIYYFLRTIGRDYDYKFEGEKKMFAFLESLRDTMYGD